MLGQELGGMSGWEGVHPMEGGGNGEGQTGGQAAPGSGWSQDLALMPNPNPVGLDPGHSEFCQRFCWHSSD